MFGISFEHLLVLAVVLLIFGPKRLPELGHTMGRAIKNFKDAISGIEEAQYKKIPEPTRVAPPADIQKTQEPLRSASTPSSQTASGDLSV